MAKINTNNLVVPIGQVVPNKYNPKLSYGDNKNNFYEFEKVKQSLQIAGQIQPIIVREIGKNKYEIVNGFHRWSAMNELEWTEVEIKNLGKIDFDTAVSRALLTEDTKIPIDSIELGKLLKSIVTVEKPIKYWANLLPYHPELIEQKIEMIDFDFDQYDDAEEKEDKSEEWLRFHIPDLDARNQVKMALEQAGGNEAEALVEICAFFLNTGDKGDT